MLRTYSHLPPTEPDKGRRAVDAAMAEDSPAQHGPGRDREAQNQ